MRLIFDKVFATIYVCSLALNPHTFCEANVHEGKLDNQQPLSSDVGSQHHPIELLRGDPMSLRG